MYVLTSRTHGDAEPSSLGRILFASKDMEAVKERWEGRSAIHGFTLKPNHCPSRGDYLFPHQVSKELEMLEFVYG